MKKVKKSTHRNGDSIAAVLEPRLGRSKRPRLKVTAMPLALSHCLSGSRAGSGPAGLVPPKTIGLLGGRSGGLAKEIQNNDVISMLFGGESVFLDLLI